MAMGVSTQTSPFKPSSTASFWLSYSFPRSSMAPVSSRSFWASSKKAIHRQEFCPLLTANHPFSNLTVSGSSHQFKQNASYSTLPDETECHRSFSQYKLVVHRERSPTSSACMLPLRPTQITSERKFLYGKFGHQRRAEEEKQDVPRYLCDSSNLNERSLTSSGSMLPLRPTQITSERKLLYGKFDHQRRMEEEKQEVPRYLHDSSNLNERSPTLSGSMLPLRPTQITSERRLLYGKFDHQRRTEEEKQELPRYLCDSRNLKTVSEPILHNRNRPSWFIERERLKETKKIVHGVRKNVMQGNLEGLEDVGAYENSKYYTGPSGSESVMQVIEHQRKKKLNSSQISLKDVQTNGYLSVKISDGPKESNPQTQMNRKEKIPNIVEDRTMNGYQRNAGDGKFVTVADDINETHTKLVPVEEAHGISQHKLRAKLFQTYDKVLVVDNIVAAKKVISMLTNQYRHLVHACDTEVAKIDVKQETPIDHGEITCFSIYSGPAANYGNGKSCIWVDVLDGGGRNLLAEFAPFFEDSSIKKVWHNYSFDNHVIENYGLKVSGFHADTMHMARLWDSSRRIDGGYSLEALSGDPRVMSSAGSSHDKNLSGKISMKSIFGRRKVKKDGSEGKIITIPPVEELQREERRLWICYSALDSINTLNLYESLKNKLSQRRWMLEGKHQGSMFGFYEKYWRPFGKLLVKMESEGMLVDRAYLAEMETVAKAEQQVAANRFRNWACGYCPDARYMNVGSDAQLRQLFFGGTVNRKDPNESLPKERKFKIPNTDKVIEEGKKAPTKYRTIELRGIVDDLQTDMYTATGWPSVSGDALKALAGKVSAEFEYLDDASQLQSENSDGNLLERVSASEDFDTSAYGTAYTAFGEGKRGREACHALAALCEVCSIDSLISNFILPLQGSHISGNNGRIHCSLNINTETGRLSARRPNLQNQPALEKDRYKIRQAFIAAPGNSLIVADYGQLELRILAHLSNCKSMLDAFKAGGDFHSRTAMNMYPHIREAVDKCQVLLEWHPQPGEDKPPVPLLKDVFAAERRKAKMLNFSIAYGKTILGLSRDWKVSVKEAKETVDLWYRERKEVLKWQEKRKREAHEINCVHTLLGRTRSFPSMTNASPSQKAHIERAAINTPVQGSAADVAMCAMLEISKNAHLKELGWKLLLQVHDEVILEGPAESAELAKAMVVECMSKPFDGKNILNVDLAVDAKCAQDWYSAK